MGTENALYTILVEKIKQDALVLPTLPEIALKVRQAADDPDINLNQMSDIIGHDPALSLGMLKVANSAILGRSVKVETVNQAVTRIGLRQIKSIATAMALEQVFIVDACESGKAKDIVTSIYDSKASVLAKQSGVHILLATTKGTFAFEHSDPSIKHGVFTNNILTALKDKTTDKNQDKKISVIELSKVLSSPKYTAKQQYPVIRNVGSDMKMRDLK